MTTLNVIYHLARADFFERARRYSFLVTLVVMVFLTYSYVPSDEAGYITLSVDGARGLYNSAWIGSLVAILTGITLPLVGFYLVKNTVERDTQTRVGQIIATTPLTRPAYTLGKWLSNLAVLASMVGVIAIATIILQFFIGEDRSLNLLALLAPILLVVIPTMAVVSALAVLFETVGWLKGGLGNIVYFFLGSAMTMASFLPVMIRIGGKNIPQLPIDVFGIGLPLASMLQGTMDAFPNIDFRNNSIGPVPKFLAGHLLQTFEWPGVEWTPQVIASRLLWVVVAALIALLAALFFNRFDPALERLKKIKDKRQMVKEVELIDYVNTSPSTTPSISRLSPFDISGMHFNLWQMMRTELHLLRKDIRWWWYLMAVILAIASSLVSLDIARRYILPITWLWPILIWSNLGTREARNHLQELVFSVPYPLIRQLPATWLAGLTVTILTGSGYAFNLLSVGNLVGLFSWVVAALFIPSLALALAAWSGSSKLFEVVYLALWYLGPMSGIIPQADFMGAWGAVTGISLVYLLLALALLGTAYLGRQKLQV